MLAPDLLMILRSPTCTLASRKCDMAACDRISILASGDINYCGMATLCDRVFMQGQGRIYRTSVTSSPLILDSWRYSPAITASPCIAALVYPRKYPVALHCGWFAAAACFITAQIRHWDWCGRLKRRFHSRVIEQNRLPHPCQRCSCRRFILCLVLFRPNAASTASPCWFHHLVSLCGTAVHVMMKSEKTP
jgi:hypothetical protein